MALTPEALFQLEQRFNARLAKAEAHIAALEASLVKHQQAIETLYSIPAVRMARLAVGDLRVLVKYTETPAEKPAEAVEEIHAHDAAIKSGDKLTNLARFDGVGARKAG
jgi:hypothetical protein